MDFKHVLINRYEMLCIFCFFDNNSNKKVFIFVIKENLLSIMNRICNLFKIKYPIIQGGMVWCSGWRLAAAVSNNGGLGLIGAGSMHPETLQEHINKCKSATDKPFGVNIPLLYPEIEKIVDIVINSGVKIVFTSAGNPKTWTEKLHNNGITVVHVVSSSKFAIKSEETTTMCLIPQIKKCVSIPVIAAGGIASGESMFAAMALGADGVQMGTRFALTEESSADFTFKERCLRLNEGDTQLVLKKVTHVRVIKNEFYQKIAEAEDRGATVDELREILGKGRSKKGIFEGDIYEGELEIGQIASTIHEIKSVGEVIQEIVNDYNSELDKMKKLSRL